MIRHPFLRAFQILCAALAAALGLAASAPPDDTLKFSVTLLGERERPDGSWEGVDLMRAPQERVDRVQITVTVAQRAQAYLEAVTPAGAERVFPALNDDPTLKPDRVYAFPAPHSFYDVVGRSRLRLTLVPDGASHGAARPADIAGALGEDHYRLSDGLLFPATEQLFLGKGRTTLEFTVLNDSP
jgi:hypothetical protein